MLTQYQIDKIRHPELRVILFHCGLPYRSHASTISGLRAQLLKINQTSPDQAQQVYHNIHGRLRSNTDVVPVTGVDMDAVQKMVEKEVKHQRTVEDAKSLAKLEGAFKKQITEEVDKHAKKLNKFVVKIGNKVAKKVDGVLPEYFELLCKLASSNINIMMVGPAGSGKTFIASKVAEAIGVDYGSISCSAGMSESQVTGWLIPVGANGKFVFVPATFIQIYENGGLFLFDELDNSDPNMLVFLNQAIANDHFFLPQRHNKPKVIKHKDFVCMAAANTYGLGADAMYVGRNQLDAATLDRFRAGMIKVDYSEIVEKALIDPAVYEWGLPIREAISAHGLRRIMSTRVMLDLSKLKRDHDLGQDYWEQTYFCDWSRDELRKIGHRPV